MTPFFSIIIPVYNVAPYLRECLDSVLAQTFTDWEAICVDDGSTDGSGAILDEYAAKDRRYKVIHQKNAGVSVTRNIALDVANGAWVGFLDADDVVEMDWLKTIALSIEPEIDWIRTGWTDWYINGNEKVKYQSKPKGITGNVFKQNVISVGWQLISTCAFPFLNFYRRVMLSGLRFADGIRFREDALFGYAVAAVSRGLKISLQTSYLKRERFGSATLSYRRRNDTINLLAKYIEICESLSSKIDGRVERESIVKASTFWVHKDVCQWFAFCPDRTLGDTCKVWNLVRKLLHMGAISNNIDGTRFDALRWRLYLMTGLGRLLLINRLNLLGLTKKIKE
ncbi:MAG: glycosyltransferase [Kiritimatiellae bacterium]|nr:glycosyltransferase [Kiritimatiellia bacterium]